jgi:SAM-dependent methyltransferase
MYSSRHYTELPWYSRRPSPWLVRAVQEHWIRPPGPVVDLGCGAGSSSLWLASEGFRVSGIDLAPSAIGAAQQRARRAKAKVDLRAGSVTEMPFKSASFAAALDMGCFHCLPRKARGAYREEVARVLRPGGSLLLTWIAREETGEYGPPHRPSLEEVAEALEPSFLFLLTEHAGAGSPGAWAAMDHRLARYSARLVRRRSPQPPVW